MKKIVVWSSVVVMLLTSANVFALPKLKRIKINGVNVRIKSVSKAGKRPTRISKDVQQVLAATRKAVRSTQGLTLQQRVERAIWNAEFKRQDNGRILPASHSEVPTRTQAAGVYEQAKVRSKKEGDPNILVRQEVEISFMRYKRDRLSKQLNEQVEQLRAQHQNLDPELQVITKYYDGLRKAEIEHHRAIETNILNRRINGDTHAQYEHEPELNRHLDELDKINEAEIEAWRNIGAEVE